MIIKSKQTAFLHIGKTGGSYVRYSGAISPVKCFQHNPCVVDSPGDKDPMSDPRLYVGFGEKVRQKNLPLLFKDIKKFFVFTNIRNIFEWLVSYGGHVGVWQTPQPAGPLHPDYKNGQKGFEYLVNTLINREEPHPCRKFLFTQIFSSRGNLVPDWINFTHSLDEDLQALAIKNNLTYNKKHKKREGLNKDYRTYFTDSLAERVMQTWKREMDIFGFGFESRMIKQPFLYRDEFKHKILYTYYTDKLFINNKLVQ